MSGDQAARRAQAADPRTPSNIVVAPRGEAINDKPREQDKEKPDDGKVYKFHSFLVNACKFTVDSKYSPVKLLGQGAYGMVCSAEDKSRDNTKVAIKKIARMYDDLVDAKRILRELKLLAFFNHPHVVGLLDLIPGIKQDEDDLYMVLEHMETDLHKIIKSKNVLTDDHHRYFTYQILRGLKYMHSARVIHRDLKPSNILLNSNCDLKICDFGLARGFSQDEKDDNQFTEYVVTRWYRAPEVMCASQDYDFRIDMWSVGCILAELLGRRPLFPGDDYIQQMNLIFDVLGTPSEEELDFVTNKNALDYIRNLDRKERVAFSKLYKSASPLALDLLQKMLQFSPTLRISVDDALAHPYFAELRQPEHETIDAAKQAFDFSFETKQDLRVEKTIRDLVREEVQHFRPQLAQMQQREQREAQPAKEAAKKE